VSSAHALILTNRVLKHALDKKPHKAALALFKQQSKKGTSVTDCADVTVMRRFDIPQIFSFDNVYRRGFNLKLVA